MSAVEAAEIEKTKARARHFLKTKLKRSLLHKTATFLWSQFHQLRMLPEDERLEVYAHVRELLAPTDELEEYLHGKKDYSCPGVFELCDFWRAREKEFPTMPFYPNASCASLSASSERNLSAAGYVMQARETCLKKDSMDNL
ncbi:hypothetical protein HPB47_017535, partial [Ixodes persulcatus]